MLTGDYERESIIIPKNVVPWDEHARGRAICETIELFNQGLRLVTPALYTVHNAEPPVLSLVKNGLSSDRAEDVMPYQGEIERASDAPIKKYLVMTGDFGVSGRDAFGFVSFLHEKSTVTYIVFFKKFNGRWEPVAIRMQTVT